MSHHKPSLRGHCLHIATLYWSDRDKQGHLWNSEFHHKEVQFLYWLASCLRNRDGNINIVEHFHVCILVDLLEPWKKKDWVKIQWLQKCLIGKPNPISRVLTVMKSQKVFFKIIKISKDWKKDCPPSWKTLISFSFLMIN